METGEKCGKVKKDVREEEVSEKDDKTTDSKWLLEYKFNLPPMRYSKHFTNGNVHYATNFKTGPHRLLHFVVWYKQKSQESALLKLILVTFRKIFSLMAKYEAGSCYRSLHISAFILALVSSSIKHFFGNRPKDQVKYLKEKKKINSQINSSGWDDKNQRWLS